jgi:hypothetical protein
VLQLRKCIAEIQMNQRVVRIQPDCRAIMLDRLFGLPSAKQQVAQRRMKLGTRCLKDRRFQEPPALGCAIVLAEHRREAQGRVAMPRLNR